MINPSHCRSSTDSGRLDQLLDALANGVRREILERLRHGDATAGDLATPFDVSLPAISRHLRILEEAQLVRRRVEGRTHFLQLVPETFREVDDWLAHYRVFWNEQLDALARHVENRTSPRKKPRNRTRPRRKRQAR